MSQVSQHLNDLSAFEGRWSLDPEGTTVEFHTKIMRLVPVRGTIKAIVGGVSVGADGDMEGNLVLDATSIDTGIRKRDIHLRTADFFHTDQYPTIDFTAHAARRFPSLRFEVAGTLTLHGQTRPLTTFVDIHRGATDAIVSANFDLDRTAWEVGRTRFGPSTTAHVVIKSRFVRE